MRISEDEMRHIKESFALLFGEGEVYLFGSRTDDSLKGGDIDLFLIPQNKEFLYDKKIKFLEMYLWWLIFMRFK